MPSVTRENTEIDVKDRVIEIYQPGKGYKANPKAFGTPGTTERAIIHKQRKPGTVRLPRSGSNVPEFLT